MGTTNYYTWLENLSVGDKVIVYEQSLGYPYSIGIVTRVTPSLVFVGDRSFSFSRKHGMGPKGYSVRPRIQEYVENSDQVKEIRAEHAKLRAMRTINNFLKSEPKLIDLLMIASKIEEITKVVE